MRVKFVDELHEWDSEKMRRMVEARRQQQAIFPVCPRSALREFAIFDRKTGKRIGGGFRTR